MVQLSWEREREELQYLVIMLILPFRSLFKLWPNKIAPFDNIFFMDFYKMHQNILDKELLPKSVKASLMYLYICQWTSNSFQISCTNSSYISSIICNNFIWVYKFISFHLHNTNSLERLYNSDPSRGLEIVKQASQSEEYSFPLGKERWNNGNYFCMKRMNTCRIN